MRYLVLLLIAAVVAGCGGSGGTGAPAGYSLSNGWVTSPTGLKFKDTVVGTGAQAFNGSRVTVNYTGWLDDGTVFDSSLNAGRSPFSFTIGNGEVIKGWDEGVKGMRVGGKTELVIPPDLGYGNNPPSGSVIPPNATLHFSIELLSVE